MQEFTFAAARKHLKRALKDADKRPWAYTEEELHRLKVELRDVNQRITQSQREDKNGFGYKFDYAEHLETLYEPQQFDPEKTEFTSTYDPEISDFDLSDPESRGDDGVHSESVEPEESGESESSRAPKVLL